MKVTELALNSSIASAIIAFGLPSLAQNALHSAEATDSQPNDTGTFTGTPAKHVQSTANPIKSNDFVAYSKAAARGIVPAMYRLGVMYLKGEGVSKDYDQARTWFQMAMAQGDTNAMNELGLIYKYGTGVPKNEKLGIELISKAAALGNAPAQCNLGTCYRDGTGVAGPRSGGRRPQKKVCERANNFDNRSLSHIYSSDFGRDSGCGSGSGSGSSCGTGSDTGARTGYARRNST